MQLQAFPNPFDAELNLVFESTGEAAQWTIVDVSGRTVAQQTLSTVEGQNQFNFSTSTLNAGTYIGLLQLGDARNAVRIVKQ